MRFSRLWGRSPVSGLYYHEAREPPTLQDPVDPDAEGVTLWAPGGPTREQVVQARAQLGANLLGEFPFADAASRANAMALLLAPFCRELIDGPTPLHLIDAPTPGTGKGLLAEICISLFNPGGVCTTAPADSREEWRKRITAALARGSSHLWIDNINRKLDSAELAAALTAIVWSDRLLGSSQMVELPVRCVWIATGNNLSLSDEIARRGVWIRLNASMERPWQRDGFRYPDLRAWAHTHRPALVHCALTLVQNWLNQGSPAGTVRLGSYEAWSRVMGDVLEAAGIGGYLANRTELYERLDSSRAEWLAFLSLWWEAFASKPVTVAELIPLLRESDLLAERLGDGGDRSRRCRLGNLLASRVDRIFGEMRLVGVGLSGNARQYRLERVAVARS